MSLTVTEAQAVCDLLAALDPIGIRNDARPEPERVAKAVEFLAARAQKTLMAGPLVDPKRIVGMLAGAESDGAAQAVCRAIDDHLGHGGSLPWPSIRKPFEAWQAAHAEVDAS